MHNEDVVVVGPCRQLELLAAGGITSRHLTEVTLAAAHAVNTDLHAFVAIDDTAALAAADDADWRRAAGESAPMLGVPIAIKDDTDMSGRLTGWGSSAMVRPAEHDADIVARIRAAGMVPIGKTTLPELAICGFTKSETYGVTRNPHHREHTPGGSSGGSAAAVAAAGTDPRSLRIGVDLGPFRASVPLALDSRVAEAVGEAADLLRNLGHDVRDVKVSYGMAAQAMTVRYLAGIRDAARATDEPSRLERRTRQIAMLGKPLGSTVISRAQSAGQRLGSDLLVRLGVDILLTPTMSGPALRVGRWAGNSGLATVLSVARFYAYTPAWNHTGQPAVSLPAGITESNLPLAIQFIAAPGDDARLMSLAGQVERAR